MVRREPVVRQTDALTLAADIGGTHMRAALVDQLGEVLVHQTVPTPAHDDSAALVEPIRVVKSMSGVRTACHAVVGSPARSTTRREARDFDSATDADTTIDS